MLRFGRYLEDMKRQRARRFLVNELLSPTILDKQFQNEDIPGPPKGWLIDTLYRHPLTSRELLLDHPKALGALIVLYCKEYEATLKAV